MCSERNVLCNFYEGTSKCNKKLGRGACPLKTQGYDRKNLSSIAIMKRKGDYARCCDAELKKV